MVVLDNKRLNYDLRQSVTPKKILGMGTCILHILKSAQRILFKFW